MPFMQNQDVVRVCYAVCVVGWQGEGVSTDCKLRGGVLFVECVQGRVTCCRGKLQVGKRSGKGDTKAKDWCFMWRVMSLVC